MLNGFHANKNFGKDLFKNTSVKSQPNAHLESIQKSLDILEERYQKKMISSEEYQQKVKELIKERDKYQEHLY